MLLIGLGLLARFASDAVWQRLFQWRLDQGETEPGMVSQLPTAADAWPVARDALLRLVLIAGVSLSAVIAWRRLATRRHVTAVAVAALIVPEMWLFSFGQMETASTAPVTLPPEWIDEIRRESPHARVLSDVVTPNAFMTAGLDTPLGYVGNLPARMNHLLTALSGFPPDRSMAGADANPRLAERITQSAVAFRIAREGNSLALTPVRNPRPRAHFSAYQEIVPNETAALLALRSAAIDIRSIDIVESESTSALRDIAAPRAEDRVTFTEALPRHVTLETEAAGPRLLVLMDTFDPDWRCTLDGAPAEILPVNVAFRGVVVPAGRHTVEFTHTPGGFRTGALLSCVGLALALGLFVIPLVARVLLRDRDRPA
jgi:hypothetical protein